MEHNVEFFSVRKLELNEVTAGLLRVIQRIIDRNFFDVSLTVHLSITLANDQLDAQIFNTFITILYMYMFRAISCSFSGGQVVLTL